jgi:hypothetical protein
MLLVRSLMPLLVVLFSVQLLKAQWLGTNPVYFNAGNVGIGTSTPGYKLQVHGNSIFGNPGSGYDFTTIDANGNLGIGTQPFTNMALSIKRYANVTAGIRFENTFSGNTSFAALQMGQDVNATGTKFLNILYASNAVVSTGVYQTNGSTIYNNGSGGLSIGTDYGAVRFFAGGWQSNYERMRIVAATGNVGIGTTSPNAKLDVQGNWFRVGSDFSGIPGTRTNNTLKSGEFTVPHYNNSEEDLVMVRGVTNGTSNVLNVGGGTSLYNAATIISFWTGSTNTTTTGVQRMQIDADGNVAIGTTDPKGYRLAVNGEAIFTKVKVKAYASWPDYVFDLRYKLRPLSEVEKYIQEHHHLPEVPSAAEVEKNGLDLGDNQAALLKKIEELTLYVINQDKINKEQAIMLQQQKQELLELRRLLKKDR